MADFRHLLALSDNRGVFEHAALAVPRPEHGYCADDVGRALVVACREPTPNADVVELAHTCIGYLTNGSRPDGRFRNRLSVLGEWGDDGASDDASARAIWGIGTALARGVPEIRERALSLVDTAMVFRSPFPRATAVAVLGASEVLSAIPDHAGASRLLEDALRSLPRPVDSSRWPWPEPRLTYANALLPDALVVAGSRTGDGSAVVEGLEWLRWLVTLERHDDHFSFTPTGGWFTGEPRPAFDQQPIEAATVSDACWRAWELTGDVVWAQDATLAIAWFHGTNDTGVSLAVTATGGGADGLTAAGRNENQGAESTISLILAAQLGELLASGHAAHSTLSNSSSTAASETFAAPTARSAAPYVR